jgi:transcriptional regulator with XRE-family HTH domain
VTGSRRPTAENVKRAFGRALRSYRSASKLSQEKLAELAGLHRTYASSVERGERNISLENMVKLGTALGVPLSRLIERMERELVPRTRHAQAVPKALPKSPS